MMAPVLWKNTVSSRILSISKSNDSYKALDGSTMKQAEMKCLSFPIQHIYRQNYPDDPFGEAWVSCFWLC